MNYSHLFSRRQFLRRSSIALGAALAAPAIVPSSVLGAGSPGNRIQIGVIGVGRIAREHDMPGVLKQESARIIAVSDLDSKRCADGKKFVEDGKTFVFLTDNELGYQHPTVLEYGWKEWTAAGYRTEKGPRGKAK